MEISLPENKLLTNIFQQNSAVKSISYASLLLGVPLSEEETLEIISQPKCKTKLLGVDAKAITKALKRLSLKAHLFELSSEDDAKERIDEALKLKIPVIVSIEGKDHWAVVIGSSEKGYYYIDTIDNDEVGICSWKEISSWLCYEDGESDECYRFITVGNGSDKITCNIQKLTELFEEDEDLIQWWSYYLSDIWDLFTGGQSEEFISAKDFLNKHKDIVMKSVLESCLNSDDEDLEYELNNYIAFSDIYNLKVPKELEKITLLKLTSYLTIASC